MSERYAQIKLSFVKCDSQSSSCASKASLDEYLNSLEVRLFLRKSFVNLNDGEAPIDYYMSTNFSMQLDTTVVQSANIFLRPSQLIRRYLYGQDDIVETFTVSEEQFINRKTLTNDQSTLASISFRLDS